MAVISKHHFDPVWTDMPCNEVVHPFASTCLQAAPTFFIMSLFGSAKFYSLIYLVQIVAGRKKLKSKEQWMKLGQNYLRSIVTGMMISATGFQMVCLFRNLLGKYTHNTLMRIPFALSGVFLGLESPSRRRWAMNAYWNMLIEYCLICLEKAGYISISKTRQVLLFMVGNALLLYLMRLGGDKQEENLLFWLFTPEKVRIKSESSTKSCPHEGDCQKHILKAATTYFGIAFVISMAKVILPRIRTPVRALSLIRPKHFSLALFLSSYVGVYKAIICYLCRKNGVDSPLYALPAGCVAGLSFAFSPNLALTIAPFTAALKLYSKLFKKNIFPSNDYLSLAMYCVCQGILFNGRILNPDFCPRYVFYIMNSNTNGLANSLAENFYEILKNNKLL